MLRLNVNPTSPCPGHEVPTHIIARPTKFNTKYLHAKAFNDKSYTHQDKLHKHIVNTSLLREGELLAQSYRYGLIARLSLKSSFRLSFGSGF